MGMTPLLQAHHAMEKVEEFVHKVMSSHSGVPHMDSVIYRRYYVCRVNQTRRIQPIKPFKEQIVFISLLILQTYMYVASVNTLRAWCPTQLVYSMFL